VRELQLIKLTCFCAFKESRPFVVVLIDADTDGYAVAITCGARRDGSTNSEMT